ncbi:MAG: enoyl-CoA hydratase-related protein, partial [Pseudomonadota bacterium]
LGKNLAKEICLTGDMIGAQQALAIGLVNTVFPPESLMEETMATARSIAAKSKLAVQAVKQVIDRGAQVDLRTACALETQTFGVIRAGGDSKEGLTAFAEKRKPQFKGDYEK